MYLLCYYVFTINTMYLLYYTLFFFLTILFFLLLYSLLSFQSALFLLQSLIGVAHISTPGCVASPFLP